MREGERETDRVRQTKYGERKTQTVNELNR
jgi:hypothetical protein